MTTFAQNAKLPPPLVLTLLAIHVPKFPPLDNAMQRDAQRDAQRDMTSEVKSNRIQAGGAVEKPLSYARFQIKFR